MHPIPPIDFLQDSSHSQSPESLESGAQPGVLAAAVLAAYQIALSFGGTRSIPQYFFGGGGGALIETTEVLSWLHGRGDMIECVPKFNGQF